MKIIFKLILGFIFVFICYKFALSCENNIRERNLHSRCARCNNDLNDNEREIVDDLIICKNCYETHSHNNSKERLKNNFYWWAFLCISGLIFFVFAIQPFKVLKDEMIIKNVLYVVSMFGTLVGYPVLKLVEISNKLLKI